MVSNRYLHIVLIIELKVSHIMSQKQRKGSVGVRSERCQLLGRNLLTSLSTAPGVSPYTRYPYSRLGSLKMEPCTIPVDSYPIGRPPLSYLAPQGIANTSEYLQHYLHELTERQNVSENNINTILAALTAQLQ